MSQDQWFENLLSKQERIEDAGFTLRVMSHIPPAVEERRTRNIILGSSAIGCALAAPFVMRIPTCGTSFWLCPPVLIAAFITVTIAAVMLWEQPEREF